MSATVALHVAGARELLTRSRWQAAALHADAAALSQILARAAVSSPGSADLVERIPWLIRSVADQLGDEAADLAWRVAYVEGLGADGVPTSLPERDRSLRRLDVVTLIGDLAMTDSERRLAVLNELVIRMATDQVVARTVSEHLGIEQARALREIVEYEMLEVAFDAEVRHVLPTEASLAAQAERAAEVRALVDAYGLLLAGLSHDPVGRHTIRDLFALDAPDDRTEGLPVALRVGHWNGPFLLDLTLRVLDEPQSIAGHFGTDLAVMQYPMGREFFPRLDDPHTVLLEALARDGDAARRFMFEHDGFWRLRTLSDGYFQAFTTGGPTQVIPGIRIEQATTALARVALTDPAHLDAAYEALIGEYRPGEDRRNTGVLWTIANQGRVLDSDLAVVLAEAWAMQWGNLANDDPARALATTLGGDALAVLFRDDAAREYVLGSFAPFLESRFADAVRAENPVAIVEAVAAAEVAFELLDAGLDQLTLSPDDRRLLRSAFGAGVGHATKVGAGAMSMAAFPTAVLLFVGGELARAVSSRAFPDEVVAYPSSQSVLEDLFIGGDAPDGARYRQPALGEVALANAVLAARPELAAQLPNASWFVDGTIVVPFDPHLADAFAVWFRSAVHGDPTLRALVVDTIEELAQRAATVSTPS